MMPYRDDVPVQWCGHMDQQTKRTRKKLVLDVLRDEKEPLSPNQIGERLGLPKNFRKLGDILQEMSIFPFLLIRHETPSKNGRSHRLFYEINRTKE